MPRRREPDTEDALLRCPHCHGKQVVPTDDGGVEECPICRGEGRVSRPVWNQYVAEHPNWHGLLA